MRGAEGVDARGGDAGVHVCGVERCELEGKIDFRSVLADDQHLASLDELWAVDETSLHHGAALDSAGDKGARGSFVDDCRPWTTCDAQFPLHERVGPNKGKGTSRGEADEEGTTSFSKPWVNPRPRVWYWEAVVPQVAYNSKCIFVGVGVQNGGHWSAVVGADVIDIALTVTGLVLEDGRGNMDYEIP